MIRTIFSDERGRLLFDAARSLVAELEPDTVLEELLTAAMRFTGARYAAIGVLAPDRTSLERFITRGIDAQTREMIGDLPSGLGVLGELITHPQPLRLDRVGAHPKSHGFPPHHPPMTTFLGVPIVIRGRPWGNLYLTDKAGDGPFDDLDEEAALLLAEWSAIAVDNARNYASSEERRTELEAVVAALEATTDVILAVGGEPDLERVLELIVGRGRALVDASALVIGLREGPDLIVTTGAGSVDHERLGSRLAVPHSRFSPVLDDAQSLRLDTIPSDLTRLLAAFPVHAPRAALIVPLVYRNETLGVLAAFDPTDGRDHFDGDDQRLLTAFAASAATAVAGTRTVATDRLRSILSAQEAERARWARELHDETLQDLAALSIQLEVALNSPDEDKLRAAVARSVQHAQRQARSLRGLITDLRPADLDALGLAAALDALAERVTDTTGLRVAIRFNLPDAFGPDDTGRLHHDTEATVYRIVQEAIGNAARHSRARQVTVTIRRSGDELVAEVTDDGDGFDVDAPTHGFGLAGMRERVLLVGGQLDLASSLRGTTVRAAIPLRNDDNAPSAAPVGS